MQCNVLPPAMIVSYIVLCLCYIAWHSQQVPARRSASFWSTLVAAFGCWPLASSVGPVRRSATNQRAVT